MPKTKVPDPQMPWINIFDTYRNITKKLNEPNQPRAKRLENVDYYIKRLKEDRASIESGGDALDH